MNWSKTFCALAIFALCISAWSGAQVSDKVKVGYEKPYQVESAHPYGKGAADRPVVWEDRVYSPGAKFIRVHFADFDLSAGDYVSVSSVDGAQFWTYTLKGLHGNKKFWSFAVDGETAVIRLHAGNRSGYGYRIDKIAHGSKNDPEPEVVCGTDGREDIACYSGNSAITNAQRSVARLLFQSGGGSYLCTGSLVAGSNNSTLMTNNHCFSTQTETNTLQAKFNFQRTTCGGNVNAPQTDYAGGTFLKTNSVNRRGKKGGLDYTLVTLQGNPEATWGELTATSAAPVLGENLWFIQHPGGNPEEIGYWEDAAQTARCNVDTVGQTYGQSATGSQMGYGCDSEGGSSGSPIIKESNGRVFGLHHFGGVSSNPCLNSGTMMSRICADAGSLLSCASN